MPEVKIFTSPMCTQCIRVKEFLNFNDIEFEEANIEEDQDAKDKVKELVGEAASPVVAIGEEYVKGFDRDDIVQLLQDNGYNAERRYAEE